MAKTSAYVGFSALWNPDPISSQRLKISTLLFDTVNFETIAKKGFVDYAITISGGAEKIKDSTQKALEKVWLPRNEKFPEFSIYGEKDNWPWTTAEENLKNATLSELNANSAEELDRVNYEQYKLGGYSMSEIIYWQKYYSKSVYLGSETIYGIIKKLSYAEQPDLKDQSNETLKCPDLLDLSWDEICSLRKSDFLMSFRKKYNELAKKGETKFLMEHYQNGLSAILDEIRPNVRNEIFRAVIVNLPIPIVNPLSIASSGIDIYKSYKMSKNFGWLFFVKDALKLKEGNK